MRNLLPIFALAFSSFFANASVETCGLDDVKGEYFEFGEYQEQLVRHDSVRLSRSDEYSLWFQDANTDRPLSKDVYFGRVGKVQSDSPVKRVIEGALSDVSKKRYVRYYSATIDNCKQVFVRIVEDNYPEYFNPESDMVTGKFDFLEQQWSIGISMLDIMRDIASKKVSYLTVNPDGDGQVFFVDTTGSLVIPLKRYETLSVLDVRRSPFFLKGDALSNFSIKVRYQGREGYVNADFRYLEVGNPLLNVRQSMIEPISKGKLKMGMLRSEIVHSLGLPDKARSFPVYRTFNGFVTDYDGSIPESADRIGHISHLYYSELEKPIILDMNGVLSESIQRFSRYDLNGLPSVFVN